MPRAATTIKRDVAPPSPGNLSGHGLEQLNQKGVGGLPLNPHGEKEHAEDG
jgi:hypothetical protein